MDKRNLIRFLKEKVELFESFDNEELAKMVEGSWAVDFVANEYVVEYGGAAEFLGVLVEGQAEISFTDDAGIKHVVQKIGPGELFGVPSLMTGNKTIHDVAGLTESRALLVPQHLFRTMIVSHPEAVAVLSRVLLERMKHSSREMSAGALARSDDPYGLRLRTAEPMKILVINSGRSTIKYTLFDTADQNRSGRGRIEQIGPDGARHSFRSSKGELVEQLPPGRRKDFLAAMVKALTDPDKGVLKSPADVTALGHRVVHGGDKFIDAEVVTDEVLAGIEEIADLAPLHNPIMVESIRAAKVLFPEAPHVAVFDTAFHQTMPAYAYLYGLPHEYFTKKGIRRFGFHGQSHRYVSLKVAEYLKRPYNELETIVCHLGTGASICGIDHGRSVDTTMGLTPLEGLIMGTRTGDLDAGILLYLMKTEGLSPDDLGRLLYEESGLKGMSGLSSDMQEIEAAAEAGDHKALMALKTFSYRVRKYIGAYVAAMEGLDVLAFTGGIGQGSVGVRSLACQGLARMGIKLDEKKNRKAVGVDGIVDISAADSRVRILVAPSHEQLMIARDTIQALERRHITDLIRTQTAVPIPIEVSAHHVHLCPEHVDILFGEGHELTPLKELSQPGQFACVEQVDLIGPKGRVKNVRILGPTRKETQVEIAMTEQYQLGVQAPIRESGDVAHTPGVTLEGPLGTLIIEQGVICAMRHIHMTPEDALGMGLKDKDVVRVRVPGERELIFGDVLIRVSPKYRLAMHIDTDEANAADIATGVTGYIDGLQKRR